MQFFEAIFKMFGRAVFEVTEVKGGHMVKNRDLEAEKNQISIFVFMSYGHFPTRNGSK